MENGPRGREKHVTGQGKDVRKKGSGLGTGPVGKADGYASKRPSSSSYGSSERTSGTPVRGGGKSKLLLIILAVILLGGGGSLSGIFGNLLGGGGSSNNNNNQQSGVAQYAISSLFGGGSGSSGSSALSLLGGSSTSSGWSSLLNGVLNNTLGTAGGTTVSADTSSYYNTSSGNTSVLNTIVSHSARDKRTVIRGNGQDKITIMVYMCGTDLESSHGMGTADINEMKKATLGNNINLVVCTGGCSKWRTGGISNKTNQIYVIANGKLNGPKNELGSGSMTNPSTLTAFIQYCAKNYKANRYELIFWDHGGGSLSGFGYDETHKSSGSMNLTGIKKALSDAGVMFDFIGFDACLMATTETALMLSDYADYMIASEESEPGVGWYYTNWLTRLGKNTSMPTVEIGKNIVDDFVDVCAQTCRGQAATLSVVDLAELESTVPQELKSFASSTSELMQQDDYKTVSNARSKAREFAPSSRIDQVDLVDLANKIGTDEAKELASALLSAVKYNRTSSNMTNAYGLSIYFPYKKISQVDSAVNTFEAIGMDDEYMRCIQEFASLETGGQAVNGGAGSALSSLLSGYSSLGTTAGSSSDAVSSILSGLLGGSYNNVSGLSSLTSSFLGRGLDVERATAYLTENRFDASQLVWTKYGEGYGIHLDDDQWGLVDTLLLNVFYDDGEGYIDLGLDNVFTIDEYGVLIDDYDKTWLAINNQPVPYYHVSTFDDGKNYTITGRVPCLLNDVRADLILVFDNESPYGVIAGARYDYRDGETETTAKTVTELQKGDEVKFVCDYYTYDGEYQDSYLLDAEPLIIGSEVEISNVYLPREEDIKATYLFTDIYEQEYWTPVLP